mmetsp:Transcript_15869/g.34482  ORF Transcript_15869/g.34482 Transcript_15869/m.34482 type:complete len:155 (+) Transcript_15869:73-537(+)
MSTQEERSVVSGTHTSAAGGAAGVAAGVGDLSSLLLDAKLAELINSIRALARSNDELRDALKEHPDDRDFIIAIQENEEIIVKRREAAAELCLRLRNSGVDTDLPSDILEMDVANKGSTGGSQKAKDADSSTEDKEVTEEVVGDGADADGGLYL